MNKIQLYTNLYYISNNSSSSSTIISYVLD